MNGNKWLTERFEASRRHLRAVAYRILGSLSEADDAVQDFWLRMSRPDASSIENLEVLRRNAIESFSFKVGFGSLTIDH
jgi:DNA-directed RNA polymerase specialized sigma24 family protein